MEEIFDGYPVVTPTTTLGHIAAIPVLVNDEDAVIVDHQAHNSIQTAITLLKPRGIHVELLRHSRMDLLEERIKILHGKHNKIWYMADGIYSMFGDSCPVKEIYTLLDYYQKIHFYVDDAHGMSIYGKHGRGFVLDGRQLHKKMILATSLNKSFASGGGVLLFSDKELARKVRTCGGPLITSGPMQPASLGAAVAAAKIHLSDEIYEMQMELNEKRKYARSLLEKYELPVVSKTGASVFFIGVGLPKTGYNLVKRMINAGFYVNLGIFPAVPMKQTGIRFTITRLHRFSQIEAMISTMAEELHKALQEEKSSMEDIYKAFKKYIPDKRIIRKPLYPALKKNGSLQLYHFNSITEINQAEWDYLFSGKGSFDWQGLQTLENCFTGNDLPEDNWMFDYIIIKDVSGKIIIATFLTTALWKDDMLSAKEVSEQVEIRRRYDPYYLTSKVITTGSQLTEGEHLFIDKSSVLWKKALPLLLEKMAGLQDKYQADRIVLRDFHDQERSLDDFMVDQGYFKIGMPDTNIVRDMDWDIDSFYDHLSKRSRQHFREDVRKHISKYDVSVIKDSITSEETDHYYKLYLNVKNHSLELNTFPLPKKVFSKLLLNKNWEVLVMRLKPEWKNEFMEEPVCIVYCYLSGDAYIPMFIGIDYTYNREYKVYRQALYQLVMHAKELGKKKIYLGFSANVEKHKVGATTIPTFGYMQNKDSYNMEIIEAMNRESGKHHVV